MTEIVIAVAGKVSEYLVAPIGRHLGYLFCYRRHTDELRNQVKTLGTARDDLQITVDEARRRGDEIRPAVQNWLNLVDQTTGDAEKSDENNNKKIISCFNLKSRYQLGREAYKKVKVIVEIQEARDFPDGVSHSLPPRTVTFREYESYESRDSTLNKIMDALKDDKTKEKKMIGVWGMGGVGKTTLLKQVAELAKQENLFTTQVYVDVSWTREDAKFEEGISKIQQQIAEMLGMELKEVAIPARAARLMERLKKKEKILIVLDDIWKEVKLKDVGIPSCKDDDDDDQKSDCKIVLASRDEHLLRTEMGAQESFPIQHLQEEEAWQLFKKTAGDFVEEDQLLRPVAMEVVKECHGLPVAIVTIAMALRRERVAVWKNALEELRSCEPTNIRGVMKKVYGCLELSYNYLDSEEAKSLFLLCGSLSYGDIWMDELLRYAMGLDSFDRIESLEKARNKLISLVGILKASSLLLDGEDRGVHFEREKSSVLFIDEDNKCVRMHDVVHDVARNIASKHPHRFAVLGEGTVRLEDDWPETVSESKFISFNCNAVRELPHRLVCPNLQFFRLQSNSPSLDIPIPDTFFEGMKGLKVLDLSKMPFTTLPSTLQSLTNLRTLCLDWCFHLTDIAGIGELKKLQILSMAGSNIKQLPQEMTQLTNLRLLDLNDCSQLEVIPPNILSSLSRLECLFFRFRYFNRAAEEASDAESINACLLEFNHLDHLRAVEVQIPDSKLVPTEDKFFENLTSFSISIGNFYSFGTTYEKSKTLKLKEVDDGSLLLRSGMGKLLKKTEQLELRKLGQVFCRPISVTSLDNLKILVVETCHGLKSLFLLSTARGGKGLPQLEEMEIYNCQAMQRIIEDDHVGINLQLLFPKLRYLRLSYLSNLISFGYFNSDQLETAAPEGNIHRDIPFFTNQVSFSNMEKLELIQLDKLKEMWPDHQLPLDSFSNLGVLRVENCGSLLNLIPCHLMGMGSFKNLKQIEVGNCRFLEHVFDLQGYNDTNAEFLPKLEMLELRDLFELKGIILCNNDEIHVSFPNLKRLDIHRCRMTDGWLFGKKVSFSNMETLELIHLDELKEIWQDHRPPLDSFSNLRVLKVKTCGSLLNLIPCHLMGMGGLKNLKQIVVEICHVLEHVFDLQGYNDTNVEFLPKLETLELRYLFQLKGIILCNNEIHVSFPKLKCLSIRDCRMTDGWLFGKKVSFSSMEKLELIDLPYLMKIWHNHPLPPDSFSNLGVLRVEYCGCLLNLIPCHLMGSFKNLKEIVVNNSQVLEHVFDLQGFDDTNAEFFPKLERLELRNLDGLKGVILCNNEIHVSFCNLKCLSINTCGMKEGVLFREKVSFQNLEELELTNLSMLKMIWQPQLSLGCFSKLQILRVFNCRRLVNLIPSHLIQNLIQLKKVTVHDCAVLEHVFDHGALNGDNRILLKIEFLDLQRLPKLRLVFCNKDKNDNTHCNFKDFHNLKTLHIINCEMLLHEKAWFSPNLEVLILENLSRLKEIGFGNSPKLKFLTLKKLPELSSIICNEVKNASMGCLFSPSTFKNFHNLNELKIDDVGMEYGNRRDVYTPANGVVLSNKKLCFLEGGVSNYEPFESRSSAFNQIMDALRDDKTKKMIGVWGIGGVGKTTMVKLVAEQAKQEKLFTKQVYVDLSYWTPHSDERDQQILISHIRRKIAQALGIRAADLKKRLKKEKILIILDGIWTGIDDLEKIGIPTKSDDDDDCGGDDDFDDDDFDDDDDGVKECKVVLISRDREVLISKGGIGGAQMICIEVKTLQQEEAWNLFEKTCTASSSSSGDCDCENWNIPEEVRSIANQVVEECCEGVPLGIVTIAKALLVLKDYHETTLLWKNALEHFLVMMSSTAAVGVGNKVYSFLESIFCTHFALKGNGLKSFLLLCAFLSTSSTTSSLESGDVISMDLLLQYAVGLDLFHHTTDYSLDQATNKLLSVSTCLLEEEAPPKHSQRFHPSLHFGGTDHSKFVRMLNVFHDVARELKASQEHPTSFVALRDVGLMEERSQTDEAKRCAFISLHCNTKHIYDQLPQELVCPELQLLIFHNNHPSFNFPNTFFQGMKKLQVLDLSHMGFKTLPSSLDSLANLRTLLLNSCHNLEDIALIGKLTKLEVLSLVDSGIRRVPIKMSQLTNLRLLDLNNCMKLDFIPPNVLSSLSRLECLFMRYGFTRHGAIQDDQRNACISELNHLSNLKRYAIDDNGLRRMGMVVRTDRTLVLHKVNKSSHIGDGISKLIERSKELSFSELSGTEFVLRPSDTESFLELKHLQVFDSPEIQYIIDSMDQQFPQHGAFPLLESLDLQNLNNLEEVWHGGPIPIGSFGNLKTLEVFLCHKLRYLFSLAMARGLSQLESMTIKYCKAMQQIIAYDERESEDEYGETRTNLELFSNLRTLKLWELPELINFISESETTSYTCLSTNARPATYKVSFSKLEVLKLHEVPKLTKDRWYPQHSSESFSNLRILHMSENANSCSSLHPYLRDFASYFKKH